MELVIITTQYTYVSPIFSQETTFNALKPGLSNPSIIISFSVDLYRSFLDTFSPLTSETFSHIHCHHRIIMTEHRVKLSLIIYRH